MRQQKGFSVVEILIVLAVLAILAGGVWVWWGQKTRKIPTTPPPSSPVIATPTPLLGPTADDHQVLVSPALPTNTPPQTYAEIFRQRRILTNLPHARTLPNGGTIALMEASILEKLSSAQSLGWRRFLIHGFPPAYAENQPEPVLIYLYLDQGAKLVKAYDLINGKDHTLLDVKDVSTAVGNTNTVFEQAELVRNDQLVYKLQEQVEKDSYNIVLGIYDLTSRDNTILYKSSGQGAESGNWSRFLISPNEEYLFVIYRNWENQGQGTFRELKFYSFDTGTSETLTPLSAIPDLQLIMQWASNSQAVLLGFVDQAKWNWVKVETSGSLEELGAEDYDGTIDEVVYDSLANDLYYIHEDRSNYPQDVDFILRKLAIADGSRKGLTTEDTKIFSIFLDEERGGIYLQGTDVATKRPFLKFYDSKTETVKTIVTGTSQQAPRTFEILGWAGDKDHLVVVIPETGLSLYDLDVNTGGLTLIARLGWVKF